MESTGRNITDLIFNNFTDAIIMSDIGSISGTTQAVEVVALVADFKDTLGLIMGPVGAVVAIIMFCSSFPVIRDIVKRGDVGEYSYTPYLVQWMNCILQVFWSIGDEPFGKRLPQLIPTLLGRSCLRFQWRFSSLIARRMPDDK